MREGEDEIWDDGMWNAGVRCIGTGNSPMPAAVGVVTVEDRFGTVEE